MSRFLEVHRNVTHVSFKMYNLEFKILVVVFGEANKDVLIILN